MKKLWGSSEKVSPIISFIYGKTCGEKKSQMTWCKQNFELFSCFCRLIKEEEVKKWKEHADKMRKGKREVVFIYLLLLT